MEFMYPVIVLGVIALVFGIALAVAGRKLAVPVDPKEEKIRKLLAGANCGACGFAGCDAFAKALAEGSAKIADCPVTSGESKNRIAKELGQESADTVKERVLVFCCGGADCGDKYEYSGLQDCKSAMTLQGGPKLCANGCMGFGSCVAVCPTGAIGINEKGFAEINQKKCINCGLCISACPKKLIKKVNAEAYVAALCSNKHKAAAVKKICVSGCLACGLCAKICPSQAIEMKENLPCIDYDKCSRCGLCAEKCPTKNIKII